MHSMEVAYSAASAPAHHHFNPGLFILVFLVIFVGGTGLGLYLRRVTIRRRRAKGLPTPRS